MHSLLSLRPHYCNIWVVVKASQRLLPCSRAGSLELARGGETVDQVGLRLLLPLALRKRQP